MIRHYRRKKESRSVKGKKSRLLRLVAVFKYLLHKEAGKKVRLAAKKVFLAVARRSVRAQPRRGSVPLLPITARDIQSNADLIDPCPLTADFGGARTKLSTQASAREGDKSVRLFLHHRFCLFFFFNSVLMLCKEIKMDV